MYVTGYSDFRGMHLGLLDIFLSHKKNGTAKQHVLHHLWFLSARQVDAYLFVRICLLPKSNQREQQTVSKQVCQRVQTHLSHSFNQVSIASYVR